MSATPSVTAPQVHLLEALLGRVETWAETSPLVSAVSPATVVSVATGGAVDGNALVVVSWQGTDIEAPYLATYTPAVNDVVAVVKTGAHLLILGRVVGTP